MLASSLLLNCQNKTFTWQCNVFLGCACRVFPQSATLVLPFPPSDFMNVYYQIRSSQLDRSIKGLKEHFCKNSASSGILYSPAVQTKRKDTPTKKVPKRPGEWAELITREAGSAHTTPTLPSDIILFRASLPPWLIFFLFLPRNLNPHHDSSHPR